MREVKGFTHVYCTADLRRYSSKLLACWFLRSEICDCFCIRSYKLTEFHTLQSRERALSIYVYKHTQIPTMYHILRQSTGLHCRDRIASDKLTNENPCFVLHSVQQQSAGKFVSKPTRRRLEIVLKPARACKFACIRLNKTREVHANLHAVLNGVKFRGGRSVLK